MRVAANEIVQPIFAMGLHKQPRKLREYFKLIINTNKLNSGRLKAATCAILHDMECYICGSKVVEFDVEEKRFYCDNGYKLTFDHLLPASQSGSDSIYNGRPCCYNCNYKRGTDRVYETHAGVVDIKADAFYHRADVVSYMRNFIDKQLHVSLYDLLCYHFGETLDRYEIAKACDIAKVYGVTFDHYTVQKKLTKHYRGIITYRIAKE